MSKVSSYILNFILFFALLGGVAFCAPSIKGFASTPTSSYDQTIYKSFYQTISGGGSYINTHHYVSAPTTFTSSFSFGSNSGIHGCQVEVYFITTSGSYLIATGSSNSYSVSSHNIYTSNRYFDGFACGYLANLTGFYNGSSFISSSVQTSSSMSGSADIDDITLLSPESVQLSVIESNTNDILSAIQNIDISTLESLLTSILSKVNGIDSTVSSIDLELVDIEGAIGGTNSRLTDILFELYNLKKSICYDFPLSIDGNYQLALCSVYSVSDSILLGSYNNPDYFSFRFSDSFSSSRYRFYFLVPESHKIMFIYKRLGSSAPIAFNQIYTLDGTSLNLPFDSISSDYFGRRIYTIPDNINSNDLLYIDIGVSSNASFAMYNYVVSANDILNYMKDQWAQSSSAVSDLDTHTSITDGFGSSVGSYEEGAFTSFSSAVDGAGIRGFDWSVFRGMSLFTAFVTGFYNLLPAEFALYITAVLIVGCVAVLLSAIGRVVKKGGDNG